MVAWVVMLHRLRRENVFLECITHVVSALVSGNYSAPLFFYPVAALSLIEAWLVSSAKKKVFFFFCHSKGAMRAGELPCHHPG